MVLNSAKSVKARTLRITEHSKCRIATLTTNKGVSLLRGRTHRFGIGTITIFGRGGTTRLGVGLGSASVGILDNTSNIYALTRVSYSVILGSVINVTKLHPALTTVDTNRSVTLTGGRALIANNSVMGHTTGRGNIGVLPISDRRSTVFRSLRNTPSNSLGGVLLATSNNPFLNGATGSLRGIAMGSTLGRPG